MRLLLILLTMLAVLSPVESEALLKAVSSSGGSSVSVTSASNDVIVNPSPGTGTFTIGSAVVYDNKGAATTVSIVASDMEKVVTSGASSAVAVTLPAPSTTGFGTNNSFTYWNLGTGTVTITSTSSTINGAATLALTQYQAVYFTNDGGTNYYAFISNVGSSGGSGTVNNCTTAGGTAYYSGTGTTVSCASTAQANTANGIYDAEVLATGDIGYYMTGSNAVGNVGFKFVSTATGGKAWQASVFANGGNVPGDICLVDVTDGDTSFCFSQFTEIALASGVYGWTAQTANNGAIDTGISRGAATVVDIGNGTQGNTLASVATAAFISESTKFTTSGCSISSTTGGATAGKFTLGANTCTAIITMAGASGRGAPNGWSCWANDETSPLIMIGTSSSSATTASLNIPSTAGATDVIDFGCLGY